MYDVLDNLVDKVNLSAVEVSTIQILRKCSFRRSHIKTNDFPHEFSQRLCAIFGFIVLFCANLTPKNFFEFLDILGSERDVAFQLGDGCIILMLPYIVLSFCLVIFQIIVFQLGFFPFCRKNFVREICGVPYPLDGDVLDQVTQLFSDVLKLVHIGSFDIVGLDNFFEQRAFLINLWNIGHARNRFRFFQQLAAATSVELPGKVCQFDAVQQSIKTQCFRVIRFRFDQEGKFFPGNQGICIGQRIVTIFIRIQLNIFQMLFDRKIVTIQLLHLTDHVLHQ